MRTVAFLVWCVMFASWFQAVLSANILYMSLTPSPSHTIWDKTIAMALWERGHKITFVTPSNVDSMENFTTILIEGIYDKISKFNYHEMLAHGPVTSVINLCEWMSAVCEGSLKTKGIQQIVKQVEDNIKYDLILYDMLTGHCFYPFIEKFNSPPVVATSPFGLPAYYSSSFGMDLAASYISHYFIANIDKMNFFQRLSNYYVTLVNQFWHNYVFMPSQWKLVEKFFGKNIIHYEIIEKNMSMLLANYDHNLDYPRSLPPAIIPVGGLTTKRKSFLPQDLRNYLDKAKDGVILFSLGSNILSNSMSKAKIDAFIEAFRQINQTLMWKFESHIDNLPANIIIRRWLPQTAILAHPNVKLFITQGGGLSTLEAMYHQVPFIGIPFFADHKVYLRRAVERKIGLQLEYSTLTTKTILEAINEIIHNPIYKRNIEKISKRYRDQPEDPLTRAVFWIEYTLRHGGGQHLHITAQNMPAYQVYYLDIWIFIITVVVTLYFITRALHGVYLKPFRKFKIKLN